jgi:hypothetical protein
LETVVPIAISVCDDIDPYEHGCNRGQLPCKPL